MVIVNREHVKTLLTAAVFLLRQVAWIAFDKSAILTVQEHVITRNPRVNVTYDGHRTWTLHLSRVNASDAGTYMCQVNTIVAKSQFGILNVVGEYLTNVYVVIYDEAESS